MTQLSDEIPPVEGPEPVSQEETVAGISDPSFVAMRLAEASVAEFLNGSAFYDLYMLFDEEEHEAWTDDSAAFRVLPPANSPVQVNSTIFQESKSPSPEPNLSLSQTRVNEPIQASNDEDNQGAKSPSVSPTSLSHSIPEPSPAQVPKASLMRTTSTKDELPRLRAEKSRLKRQLRQYDADFEAAHGRKPSRADKEPMRPTYRAYHALKQQISDLESSQTKTQPSTGILATAKAASNFLHSMVDRSSAPSAPSTSLASFRLVGRAAQPVSNTTKSKQSLPQSMDDLKAEKKRLQIKLRNFEDQFRANHGRKVRYHGDIAPVASDYRRYKAIKRAIASN